MSRPKQRKLTVGKSAKRTSAGALLAAAAAVAASGSWSMVFAAQHVYTPAGTSDVWSAGTNWSTAPVSGADTQLTFVGDNATVVTAATTSTSTNDLASFQLNILDLQGTGPASGTAPTVLITGNALELVANGAINPVLNLNAVAGPVTIGYTVGNNLVLTNNATITGNGTAAGTFGGAISGAGSLTKSGLS